MANQRTPPPPPPPRPRGEKDLRKADAELARLKAARSQLPAAEPEAISDVDLLIEENEGVIAEARGQASVTPGGLSFRRSPRFRVAVSVLVGHDGTSAPLPLADLSATGALIAPGHSAPKLRIGALLFLMLTADEVPTRKVEVDARVVRADANGTAVDWSDTRP